MCTFSFVHIYFFLSYALVLLDLDILSTQNAKRVICNSSSYHNQILFVMTTCAPYILSTLNNILGVLNVDIITSTSPLECLHCVICV